MCLRPATPHRPWSTSRSATRSTTWCWVRARHRPSGACSAACRRRCLRNQPAASRWCERLVWATKRGLQTKPGHLDKASAVQRFASLAPASGTCCFMRLTSSTAWVREPTPSARSTAATWSLTVSTERFNSRAISLLGRPLSSHASSGQKRSAGDF